MKALLREIYWSIAEVIILIAHWLLIGNDDNHFKSK